MSDDIHEIYAIKYGHHDRKAAENYIGGDPHDVNDPLDFYVWAIVGPSGTIVVDTGFDAVMAKKRNRALLKPIAEGLKSIDIAPDTVVISAELRHQREPVSHRRHEHHVPVQRHRASRTGCRLHSGSPSSVCRGIRRVRQRAGRRNQRRHAAGQRTVSV